MEFSYGIGLKPGSVDAKTILAGAPNFVLSDLEVFQVQ